MRRCWSIANMCGSFISWTIIFLAFFVPSEAVFLPNFTNCMAANIQNSAQLQWVPEAVWVVFNSSSMYNLNITVYGNVTGQRDTQALPPWNSSIWNNANFTNGKIIDGDPTQAHNGSFLESTLEAGFDVLSYTAYYSGPQKFCGTTNRQCPIGPVFNAYVNNYRLTPKLTVCIGQALMTYLPSLLLTTWTRHTHLLQFMPTYISKTIGHQHFPWVAFWLTLHLTSDPAFWLC